MNLWNYIPSMNYFNSNSSQDTMTADNDRIKKSINVLKASILEKNGHILQPINFIPHQFQLQIEYDLFIFFNIRIKLSDYYTMRDNFIKDRSTIGVSNTFTINNNQLIFTENGMRQDYEFDKVKISGSHNNITQYKSDGKYYIFRSSIVKDMSRIDLNSFNSFYENLKQIILYIVMCRYNKQIKIIPQPIGIGWYNDTICFLSEAGRNDYDDFFDYIDKNNTMIHSIEKICFKVYRDLFAINEVPHMNLCFKHGDLKSENIVLTDTLYPLLIDFGFCMFKIGSIEFIRPKSDEANDNFILFNRFTHNIFMNSILDFITLIYQIIYCYKIRIFDYMPTDYRFLLCWNNLHHIFDTLHKNPDYTPYIHPVEGTMHYIRIAELFIVNNILQNYYYYIAPADLLTFLSIDDKKKLSYIDQIYYKKYNKYKMKYLALQKN
jgi:hypothetical protein